MMYSVLVKFRKIKLEKGFELSVTMIYIGNVGEGNASPRGRF